MTHAAQRTAFLARLDAELARDKDSVGVFRVDLDRFPRIRQTFGATVSRSVRSALLDRLDQIVGTTGAMLTFGEDSFAAMMRVPDADPETLEDLGMRVVQQVSAPIVIAGRPSIAVGCNVGLAVGARFDRADALRLLTGAELAIQRANALGARRTIVYEVEPAADPTRVPHLFADMLEGIENDQFAPWFQPVVKLPDRRIAGAEALIRWEHPVHGVIPPGEFVEEAEKSGLIRDIDALVWRRACGVCSQLPEDLEVNLSVNISPADLDFPNVIDLVKDCLDESGLEPRRLIFEVTETTLSQDWSRARRRLEALKELGTRLAVDDFGSGHMFLDRLGTGLFDILKVDRSLIAPGQARVDRSEALLAGVTSLAQSLGMRVVAEGVEDEEQLDRAVRAGCDRAQGFLFARPMPSDDYLDLVGRTPHL